MRRMRIAVAPDSFGGWHNAVTIAQRIGAKLEDAGHEAILLPMSDGGEGLLHALEFLGRIQRQPWHGTGAYGQNVSGHIGTQGEHVYVESAEWLGTGTERRPWDARSDGLGVVLRHHSHRPITLGLGGTGTIDMGIGLLARLGIVPLDRRGRALPATARALSAVHRLDGPPPTARVRVWADVNTPLHDAAARFGPQKGVRHDEIDVLDRAWQTFAEALVRWSSDHHLPPAPDSVPGGGAAGGLGFTAACLGWPLLPGADALVSSTLAPIDADLYVTGEGKLDRSTYDQKVVWAVFSHAKRNNRPCIALVGAHATDGTPPPFPVVVADQASHREVAFGLALDALCDAVSAIARSGSSGDVSAQRLGPPAPS